MSNPSIQHSQVLYRWGWGQEKRKDGKYGKVEVKRKWLVLAQPPYSPQGNERQLPGWKPRG